MEENLTKLCNLQVGPTRFYGLLKIHKAGTPLRPIVLSRGPVTYGVAKKLAKILWPLVGKSLQYIQSAKDFVNKVSKVTLILGECLCSYDVSALLTSVPIDSVLGIIREVLEQDTLGQNCIISRA